MPSAQRLPDSEVRKTYSPLRFVHPESHVSLAAVAHREAKSEMCRVCKMEQQRQALIMTIVKGEAHDQRAAINN
jgi:hypothetical protein